MLSPTAATNPLVISGVIGAGKSLILDLLADEFQRHFAGVSIHRTTAVDLARAYAHAVQTDSIGEFRQRYSRLHLLAIDDVQRLADKPAAQQELLSLIDSLSSRGCLVLATLRKHPLATDDLSLPLASRLAAGLVVPLALPEFAARRALLEHFAADAQVELPAAAVQWLAPSGAALPRLATAPQLRRAVICLGQQARQHDRPVDRPLIEEFLQSSGGQPTLKAITAAVSKQFAVSVAELRGKSRQHSVTTIRGLAIYLGRELAGISYAQIGRYFGDRDHTTIMYACKKAAAAIATDAILRQSVDDLKIQLSAEVAGP